MTTTYNFVGKRTVETSQYFGALNASNILNDNDIIGGSISAPTSWSFINKTS